MTRLLRAAGLAGAILAASFTAAAAQAAPPTDRPEYVEPRVYSAAEAARIVAETRAGLPGRFAFIVKGGGRDARRVFLNSQVDYRDAGTLTVALDGPAAAALTDQLQGPPERALIGRIIVVEGVARPVRIDLLADGRPTGRFYVQTHVVVDAADRIHVVPGPALPIVLPQR